MGQTIVKTTNPVVLNALRLQLEEDGRVYYPPSQVYTHAREAHGRFLHTLQTNDCREIITAVVDGDDLANAFVKAAAFGHVDILVAYLHHGMNIDTKDESRWTALIKASYYEHEKAARFLLDHNADVNVQDDKGYTAMMYASQGDNTKIVEMTLTKNANADIQDDKGMTALMLASEYAHYDIVRVLLNYGANIELKNNDGKTALDLAWKEEIKEMI